jgi:hypothetical protein
MCDLHTVVQERQQVVGHNAFQRLAVVVAQPHPQPIELRPAEKRFALGFEVVRKLADEKNRAHLAQRNLHMLAVRSQQVNGVILA